MSKCSVFNSLQLVPRMLCLGDFFLHFYIIWNPGSSDSPFIFQNLYIYLITHSALWSVNPLMRVAVKNLITPLYCHENSRILNSTQFYNSSQHFKIHLSVTKPQKFSRQTFHLRLLSNTIYIPSIALFKMLSVL